MSPSLKVLALQPYFGGSHAQFHNGWLGHSTHQWTTLELPARNWKWRMRHAAIYFSQQIHELAEQGQHWDVIVATDMMNIAELKGLLRSDLREIPIVLYFHENQFVYPNRFGRERDRHFPFTNFISAIAADHIWFNSQFNFDSLVVELWKSSKRWPDFRPTEAIDAFISKSRIEPPGIETPPLDLASFHDARADRAARGEPIHLVWAARWEHDKNPQRLFQALKMLEEDCVNFRLSVIGQSFRIVPEVFEEIRTKFKDQIVRWGYQESRTEYWETLAEADVFLSTATHEFFGLSAAEAIVAGACPLLPKRLAYPELLQYGVDQAGAGQVGATGRSARDSSENDPLDEKVAAYLYEDQYQVDAAGESVDPPRGLVEAIKKIVRRRASEANWHNNDIASRFLKRLEIAKRATEMDSELSNVVSGIVENEV